MLHSYEDQPTLPDLLSETPGPISNTISPGPTNKTFYYFGESPDIAVIANTEDVEDFNTGKLNSDESM